MSIRKPQPKAAVKLLRAAFDSALVAKSEFSTKDAYNLLAQLEGYKNWAHAKEFLEAPKAKKDLDYKIGYTKEEVKDWPTFVIFMNYSQGVDCDEELFMMPPGSTFENRNSQSRCGGPFDETDSVLLPEVIKGIADPKAVEAKRMSSFVVKDVFSVVPRPEKYGLPYYANDLGVRDWILEDMGWNYLTYDASAEKPPVAFDVNFNDSGDDGSGRYWVEMAVAPDVAKMLCDRYPIALAEKLKNEASADSEE